MFRLGAILMSICLAASLVLAVAYKITQPVIEAQGASEEKEALKSLLPQAEEFAQKELSGAVYYEGIKGKTIVGYALRVKANGYGGGINMLTGIDAAGAIQGISILSHQETPGLGARITEARQGEAEPWFLEQFKGRRAQGLSLQDVQAISGATISSAAVVNGIKNEVERFLAARKE